MDQAVVYRFFDASENLLYVGVTAVGPMRWTQHAAYQDWWEQVATVTVTHYPSIHLAQLAERWAIRDEHPRYNIINRHPRTPARPMNRARGAGTVFLRNDGRWIAQISLGWAGYGRRPLRTFGTKEEAEAGLVEMLARPAESWGPTRDPAKRLDRWGYIARDL